MGPIRVGLIGLSGAPPEAYEGTSWTPNAHLPFLKASPDFEIVALLNSSVDSAQAAITRYNLPASVKAYGNPEDLASDPTLDLVVSSVRVDRHYLTVRPSIIAGKAIFVEWPLEANLSLAREMTALAAKYNAPTIIGLQGSFPPEVRTVKRIIDSGRIGRVLSSSWYAAFGNAGENESKNVRYFLDREVGGNVVQIGVGHSLEFLNYVLGPFQTHTSKMHISRPTMNIIDKAASNKIVHKDAPNTVPDQVLIHGTVSPSNALVSFQWYGGPPFPGTPAADWRILGSKGSLRLTSSSWSLNVGREETRIEVLDGETGEVTVLEKAGGNGEGIERDEWDDLPFMARNIARLYEAYRKGEWWPDWEWAVKRHEFLHEMWENFDADIKLLA